MPFSYRTSRRVEFSDTDMAGIMHFAKFFVFMEEAECELLRSRGLTVVMTHQGRRISWPRVAASCDFFKPAFFEDVLDIDITVSRIGKKSLTFTSEFSKEGVPIAKGTITSCCCRVDGPEGMVAIELPDEIRRMLQSAEDVASGGVP